MTRAQLATVLRKARELQKRVQKVEQFLTRTIAELDRLYREWPSDDA